MRTALIIAALAIGGGAVHSTKPESANTIAVSLPKGGETYGAWVKSGNDSDYHVYVQKTWVVIGHNRNTADKFSAIALALNADGTATVQYRGDDGQPYHVTLPADSVERRLKSLLELAVMEAREIRSKSH